MRNHHTEQLQERNGKVNSEKVSGQSSSIKLVYPLYTSTPGTGWCDESRLGQMVFLICFVEEGVSQWIDNLQRKV